MTSDPVIYFLWPCDLFPLSGGAAPPPSEKYEATWLGDFSHLSGNEMCLGLNSIRALAPDQLKTGLQTNTKNQQTHFF